jgi:GcrA cell cycle regulator
VPETKKFSWTEENIKRCVELWREGHSCLAIGRVLGCSRNAVIGKIHRLGEAKRGTNKRIISTREKAQRRITRAFNLGQPAAPVTQVQRIASLVAEPLPAINDATDEARVKSLFDLEPHHCRWPVDVQGQQWPGYCGDKKVIGLSYCNRHVRKAYAVGQSRQSKVAAREVVAGKQLVDA